MLTLIMGTDWTANRAEILRLLALDVADKKGGRILMVPELISHDTERRLCQIAGNTACRYADVVSFTRLVGRVAEASEHPSKPCLDNGGRIVAMAAATKQLHSKLKAYAALETRPEFLTGLVDMVDELKRCCITSRDLMEAAKKTEGSLAQKLEELSLILDSYDAICCNGRRDPRDQMTWLLEELETCSYAEERVFYVDGFPDFTRQHMAILEHLICNSVSVTISLNCDKPSSSVLGFGKAGDTAQQLLTIARKHNVESRIMTIHPNDGILLPIKNNLFQGAASQMLTSNTLCLYRTETVYQECLCAAQKIMDLVRNGVRYRDISVVCAEMSAYQNVISMVFDRCHIPLYISGTEDVLKKPVISGVMCVLDILQNGFEQRRVLDYLKSLISPLELDICDRIENYAYIWGISGNRWLEPWDKHPDGLDAKWDEKSKRQLEELNNARELAIEPLQKLHDAFRGASNLAQQVQALYDFFVMLRLEKRLTSLADELDAQGNNRESQIINQLWDILITALEQLYDVLGDTSWPVEAFNRLFSLLLSRYDVGTIPSVLDSVMVGSVSAMRCQQQKHLLVLGAVEGSLPSYGGSSGLLTDQERNSLRELGVNLTGGAVDGLAIEFSEIYGVFCGAEESITVSCPGAQPSFVYRRLTNFTREETAPAWEISTAMGDGIEACAYFARVNDVSDAQNMGLMKQYAYILDRKEYQPGEVTGSNISKLYGNELLLSASQIDRQAECRLSYFLKYGLRARELKPAAVDPAEFGVYVHAVLERTARDVKELGGFGNVTMEQALEIAQKHSAEYAKERFGALDTRRAAYIFQRNGQELDLIVQELWKEMHGCQFEAFDFEVGFGVSEERPAIPLSGQTMDAKLRGFIDRVDVWQDGDKCYFRVVDYKTGKKDFDYCDVFNGIGLQMLLYLFALEQEGNQVFGTDAFSAGVQYFPARVPMVSADGKLTEEEAEDIRERLWKRKGLLLQDETVLEAMDSDSAPNRLPVSRKKDGTVSGDIATAEQLSMLRSYVFAQVGKMVDEIASGVITPNPYTRGTSHNACTFCPYGVICHPESVEGRRNYKTMSPERFWDEVGKEVSSNG